MDHSDYEAPAVEDRTEVSAPLNTLKTQSEPAPPLVSPTWRTRHGKD